MNELEIRLLSFVAAVEAWLSNGPAYAEFDPMAQEILSASRQILDEKVGWDQ